MSITRHLLAPFWIFAERGGFEPPKPFWGLLAFQAGQFNHSCISPYVVAKIALFAKFRNKKLRSPNFLLNLQKRNSVVVAKIAN